MRSLIRILQISLALAFVLTLTTPIHAVTRVKSGSNYGATDTNSNGVTDCAQMLTPPYPEGCQAYASLGLAPIMIDGTTINVNEYAFSDGNSADFGDVFDVYDLGVGNYTTDVNVALNGSTLGVFTCGTNDTPSQASFSTSDPNFGVPCSPILSSATGDSSTMDFNNVPFVFTLNGDNSVTFGSSTNPIPSNDDLVVYVVPSTVAPEPATLTLMCLGLAAIAGLLVRRAA